MRKAEREEKKKLAQSHSEGRESFSEVEKKKTKAVMYPRDTVLMGMDDLSGKGGAVASGFSLFQQLGSWHLNLNCWVSSEVRVCVCTHVCVCVRVLAYDLHH